VWAFGAVVYEMLTARRAFDGDDFRASVNSAGRTYDVSPDGKRFLMIKDANTPSQASAPTSIVVVRNWVEELKRLVRP
jgi:hypothetical protein